MWAKLMADMVGVKVWEAILILSLACIGYFCVGYMTGHRVGWRDGLRFRDGLDRRREGRDSTYGTGQGGMKG